MSKYQLDNVDGILLNNMVGVDTDGLTLGNGGGSPSTILADNVASGHQINIKSTDPAKATFQIRLNNTSGGVTHISTTAAAMAIDNILRFDNAGESRIYCNNGGNGLSINGANTAAGHLKINNDGDVTIGPVGTKGNRTLFLINGNNSNSQTNAIGLHVKANIDAGTTSDVCLIEHTNTSGGSPSATSHVLRVISGWAGTGSVTALGVNGRAFTGIGIAPDTKTQLRINHVDENYVNAGIDTAGMWITNNVTRALAAWGAQNRRKFGARIDVAGVWTHNTGTPYESLAIGLEVNVTGGDLNYAGLFNGGGVGIGTFRPTALLHIDGSLRLDGLTTTPTAGYVLQATDALGNSDWVDINAIIPGANLELTEITTTAASTELLIGGNGGTQIIIPINSMAAFVITVTGIQTAGTGTGSVWAHRFTGLIKRISATTTLIGTVSDETMGEDTAAATWTATVLADNTTEALTVDVTGEAAKTINWSAKVELTENKY